MSPNLRDKEQRTGVTRDRSILERQQLDLFLSGVRFSLGLQKELAARRDLLREG